MPESLWTDLLGVEYTQRYYDVRGVRTRVLEAGDPDSPPLVLLHGVNGHAETYVRNIGPHAEHFRVYSVDMIGHGLSDKPLDRDYELGTYVDHVLDFLDTLGLDRVLLSGESLGGWVSARLVIGHADRVERLVLNTPGGLNAEPEVMERIKRMTLDAVSPPTREKVQKRVEWLFKDPVDGAPGPRRDALPDLLPAWLSRGARRRSCACRRWTCASATCCGPRTSTPSRFRRCSCGAAADPIAGMDVGHWTRDNIPDCEFLLMENSGHWPQFEEADKFNREHIRFLSGKE